MSSKPLTETKAINTLEAKSKYLSLLPQDERQDEYRDRLAMIMITDVKIPSSTFSDHELIRILEGDDSSPADVAQQIKLDPYISTKIFAVARSAAYRGREDIETFEEACFRLGMLELKRLIYAAQVAKSFNKFDAQVDWSLFWLKSILTARLADKLLRTFVGGENLGFLTGLLHDTGSLILWEYFQSECQMIESLLENDLDVIDAEIEVLGFHHAHASGLLCAKWNFPDKVTQGVLNMYSPLRSIGDADAAVYSAALLLAGNLTGIALQGGDPDDPGERAQDASPEAIEAMEEWGFLCSVTGKNNIKVNINIPLEIESAKILASSIMASG